MQVPVIRGIRARLTYAGLLRDPIGASRRLYETRGPLVVIGKSNRLSRISVIITLSDWAIAQEHIGIINTLLVMISDSTLLPITYEHWSPVPQPLILPHSFITASFLT